MVYRLVAVQMWTFLINGAGENGYSSIIRTLNLVSQNEGFSVECKLMNFGFRIIKNRIRVLTTLPNYLHKLFIKYPVTLKVS